MKLYLIHGFIGADKTTYARKLEQSEGAFCITHDRWMRRLYGVDPELATFQDNHSRVSDLAFEVTERLLNLDQDVILDFGFWERASRDAAHQWSTTGCHSRGDMSGRYHEGPMHPSQRRP